jgi:hypothetical protein
VRQRPPRPARRTLRQSLDDIATLSAKIKDLAKFGNPSGTAQAGAALGEIGAASGAVGGVIASGHLILGPVAALGALLPSRLLSAALSRPASAEQIAKWSRVYAGAQARPSFEAAQVLANATRTLVTSLEGARVGTENAPPVFKTKTPAKTPGKQSSADALPSNNQVAENSEFLKKRQEYEEELKRHQDELKRTNPKGDIKAPNERPAIGWQPQLVS